MVYDLVIRNGRVFDGEKTHDDLDIAVIKDRVESVGKITDKGLREIDASGLVVSPGFIDVHTHATLNQMKNNDGVNLLSQGVTTTITGNCGKIEYDLSVPPTSSDKLMELMFEMRSSTPPINVATLVGHNTIRNFVLGKDKNRIATPEEVSRITGIVGECLSEGAIGFSSGLMYESGIFAEEDELVKILEVVAKKGMIYTTHMRNEGDGLVSSVEESLRVAEKAEVRLQISHHKAVGKKNFGIVSKTLEMIIDSRKRINVATDIYLYDATSSPLSVLMPREVLSTFGGRIELMPENDEFSRVQNSIGLQKLCLNEWDDVVVLKHKDQSFVGRSIKEISGKNNPAITYLRIVKSDEKARGIYLNISSYDDIDTVLRMPFTMVASDGYLYDSKDRDIVHPRNYGNTAKFLLEYVGKGRMGIDEALRKLTSLPADTFSLQDRGRIVSGGFADITLFDPKKIRNKETLLEPFRLAEGMSFVICNGIVAYDHGKIQRNGGRFIR